MSIRVRCKGRHTRLKRKTETMAKSLRAKSHLKAKSIKRKGVFQNVVDARTDRLAEKLKQDLIDQKMQKLKAKDGDMELDEGVLQNAEVKEDGEKMDEDKKKVSTSGWRDARHHTYKKNQKIKKTKKKGSFTKF